MKKMSKPEIEFIRFDSEDVITTSTTPDPVGDPSKLVKFVSPPVLDETLKSTTFEFVGLEWNTNQ